MRELVVGTRASALALVQTRIVCDALCRLDPSLAIRVEKITTKGDARSDVPLSALGRVRRFNRFFHASLAGGIYLPPSAFESCFVSLAHDAGVIERTVAAFDEALAEAQELR